MYASRHSDRSNPTAPRDVQSMGHSARSTPQLLETFRAGGSRGRVAGQIPLGEATKAFASGQGTDRRGSVATGRKPVKPDPSARERTANLIGAPGRQHRRTDYRGVQRRAKGIKLYPLWVQRQAKGIKLYPLWLPQSVGRPAGHPEAPMRRAGRDSSARGRSSNASGMDVLHLTDTRQGVATTLGSAVAAMCVQLVDASGNLAIHMRSRI